MGSTTTSMGFCGVRTLLLLGTMAAMRSAKSLKVSAGAAASSTCTTTHLWLVRHGARHDYANPEWRDDQLPREWVPEKRPSMVKHMAKVRERLKR